jgi:hypothetical protein
MTPFYRAYYAGNVTNLDLVEFLLEKGADPNAQDHPGNNKETKSGSSNSKSDKQDGTDSRPRLRIKPRPSTSLHFFVEEALCELPAEALTQWHSDVRALLEVAGFVTKVTAPISNHNDSASASASTSTSCLPTINTTTSLDEYWFRVEGIRTFPSRRNNLIVGVVLDASPRWHELYADIRDLARGSPAHALRAIVRSDKNEWIPHVTLANVYGGGKAEHQQLDHLLTELSLLNLGSTAKATDSTIVVNASGISMGGPIPIQEKLDWNFNFDGSTNRNDG